MVAAALLMIFTIANYAVQTHIHGISHAVELSYRVVAAAGTGSPVDNDEQHCPLCQEFLSGGSFLTPAALIVSPIFILGESVVTPMTRIIAHARSHNWQGRGPPTA